MLGGTESQIERDSVISRLTCIHISIFIHTHINLISLESRPTNGLWIVFEKPEQFQMFNFNLCIFNRFQILIFYHHLNNKNNFH